ncbi:MAG: uracil-DNA glycosylase [Pseudomonadota bacterium]|nr:uracil-DNA glycosylase [Pseudomonadota bacterium]
MTLPETDYRPRSMRDAGVRERRRAMLGLPHMVELTKFAAKLRSRGLEVPDFDPLDGGVRARALFLFEKPGPMTAKAGSGKRVGSGFISRNNDDSTAEAIFDFMQQAEIARDQTILWNVIPWWNGTRAVTKSELRDGVSRVKELIDLLPNLRAIALVGKKAAEAESLLESTRLPLFNSSHPSPLVRARSPERWLAIPKAGHLFVHHKFGDVRHQMIRGEYVYIFQRNSDCSWRHISKIAARPALQEVMQRSAKSTTRMISTPFSMRRLSHGASCFASIGAASSLNFARSKIPASMRTS